jgi:hypothetical protein
VRRQPSIVMTPMPVAPNRSENKESRRFTCVPHLTESESEEEQALKMHTLEERGTRNYVDYMKAAQSQITAKARMLAIMA